MKEEQQTFQQGQSRQRRRRWSGLLWPLLFLLIFLLTRSFAGLLVSLAIIVFIEALIAAASRNPRGWSTPPMQPTPSPLPQEQAFPPYEQGSGGIPVPFLLPGRESHEEDDRLVQLKLLGELHQAGTLTGDELARQKRRILQASETEDEAQPQVEYPQGPW